MKVQQLIQLYPNIYHMAELGSWPSIQKYGLLSTTALLDLFEVKGPDRIAIESRQRKESVKISHPIHGLAVIRDQKVLPEKASHKYLEGLSAREYYELLNGKIFFWVEESRLRKLLGGKQYKNRAHDIITVDTAKLVRAYHDSISLSPINSGAFFGTGRRGRGTFKPIEEYPFEERKKRNRRDPLVELVVDYEVKNIIAFATKVEEWSGGEPRRTIWIGT